MEIQGPPKDLPGIHHRPQGPPKIPPRTPIATPNDTQGHPRDTQGAPEDTQGATRDTPRTPQDTTSDTRSQNPGIQFPCPGWRDSRSDYNFIANLGTLRR